MDFAQALGLNKEIESPEDERQRLQLYINLKLASSGQPTCVPAEVERFFGISRDLLKSYREKNRLLSEYHCWADQRIQNFLTRYFEDLDLDPVPVGHLGFVGETVAAARTEQLFAALGQAFVHRLAQQQGLFFA